MLALMLLMSDVGCRMSDAGYPGGFQVSWWRTDCPSDPTSVQGDGQDNLSALVGILKEVDDPAFQLDILRGIRDGLKGRTGIKMPEGWAAVSEKLAKSPNAEVKEIVRSLSTTFGDTRALDAMRLILADAKADLASRKPALDTLLDVTAPGLPPILLGLLPDSAMRGSAIRGLAAYDDAKTPDAVVKIYPSLDVSEQRDAVNTLASRRSYAKALIAAVGSKVVARGDLTAATIRQLGEHRDAGIDAWIAKEWGAVRATPEERLQVIAQYKEKIQKGPKGDPSKGRAIFAKTCVQCHTLFEPGGKVGPELTGANRSDLDYVLQNILDPSAVVGKDYQATTIRLKSERVISGIIKMETKDVVTLLTENDTLTIPAADIDARKTAEISMMPEGLLAALNDEQTRDLVAYLQSPTQVPFPAGFVQEAEVKIFNGKDLTDWDGDAAVWSVDNGEIVGKGPQKKNQFLYHKTPVADFRLILEVKLVPDGQNSGIQFRSEKLADGAAKGYQADVGKGWWGKLYHEHGRALLWDKPGDAHVKVDEWNTYEVLAVGTKIRTAVNGNLCVDLDDAKADPAKDMKGLIGFQVHSGGAMEVRFRNVRVENNPKFELKTLKK